MKAAVMEEIGAPLKVHHDGSGKLRPGKMVTERIPLEKASDVLESMKGYQTVGVSVIDQW